MRKLILLLLLPIFSFAQTRQSGGISFTPQWNYKIAAGDTTWQFGNTLMSPQQFPYILTKWQSDQRYAPISGGGYVPNSRQIINGYGITGGHSLATDVTLATDTTHGSSGLLTWNYGLRFVKFGDTSSLFSNLVHKTGTETINGLKSFGNNSTWGTGNFVGTITAGYGNWYDNSGASTLQLTVRASSIQYNYGITNSTGLNFTIPTHSNSISFPDASGTVALKTDTGYFRTVANSMSLAQLHSNYQPLNAKLTSISALANSAGVLTNDGSGGFSYTTPGSGTVTAVSVALSNGFAGSSSGGATPSLTLSTTVTGIVKGNGTALSAATAGTDYQVPITSGAGTTSGAVFSLGKNIALNGGTPNTWNTNWNSIEYAPAFGNGFFARNNAGTQVGMGINSYHATNGGNAWVNVVNGNSGNIVLSNTGVDYYFSGYKGAGTSNIGTSVARIDTLGNAIFNGTIKAQTPIGTAGADSIAVKIGSSGKMGAIAGNYYQTALSFAPQNTVSNIMPEVAPATISGSVYDMLPVVLISKTGKTFVFFKRGTGHAVGGDLYLTTSTDNKTFTTPTLILHSGSYNVNNISGIVTNTGRIGVFITKQDTGTSLSTGIDCLYSDDEFVTHTTVNVTSSVLNATGSIGIGASNKIMIPVYDDANSIAKVITSTDNLATFSSTVDINNIATHTVNEAGIAYLSGTTWLALCRTAPVAGNLYQFLSTDNGATWTAIGQVDVGETSPTDIAPFLTTYNDINGRLMVEAFWSNRRSPGNISTATAAALDLTNNGVSAWVNGSFKVIVTTTADGNSGYPTFAHFNNSQYGIMAYYYGTSSILTNIKFAVWPAAGTPDVVYGDFNITGDFYKNGVKLPTGGVINWPGAVYTTPTTATNVAGTLTFAPALATQNPNLIFASATSGTTTPSFRSLVTADLPALSTLTFGTHITGTSYNPTTGAVTIATDAVTTNTNNTLVTRGSSGQFSMGALTLTSAAFSGTGNFMTNNAATTAAKWLSIANTGGSALFGPESSTGGVILTGAGAYEVSIGNNNTTNLNFGVGGTRRAWLDNSGNFTTLGGATVGGVINLKNYTVATLPAGTRGDIAYVTDALAPSYLVAVVGGGAVVTPVFYDGTNWISH